MTLSNSLTILEGVNRNQTLLTMYKVITVFRDTQNVKRTTRKNVDTLQQAKNEQKHLSECSNVLYVNIQPIN